MRSKQIKSLALCAMFIALITVGAFLRIPMPGVPFTLQFLFTTLSGLLLGGRRGLVSVCGYIFLGLAGLPVFAQGGGIGYVLQPSFGYIPGFALAALVTGSIANGVQRPGYRRLFTAVLAGLVIVYSFGTVYYSLICRFYLKTPIGLWPLILRCVILPIPGDVLLCFLSAVLAKRLIPLIQSERI